MRCAVSYSLFPDTHRLLFLLLLKQQNEKQKMHICALDVFIFIHSHATTENDGKCSFAANAFQLIICIL